MALQNVIQRILGVFSPTTGALIGVTTSGEGPFQSVLGSAQIVPNLAGVRLLSRASNTAAIALGTNVPADNGGGVYALNPTDNSSGAWFVGSVSGTVLTILSMNNGNIVAGLSVNRGDTGASIGTIVSFGTGTGQTGTYNLSAPSTIPGPLTFSADNNGVLLVGADGGRWNLCSFTITNYTQNLLPATTNTFSIGSSVLGWAQGFFGSLFGIGGGAASLPAGATVGAGAISVLDPVTGGIGFTKQNAAEIALSITPTSFFYPPLNVLRYGAKGDNVTDDGPAIRTAIKVAKQQGGGTIVFPFGLTYFVSSLDPASPISLPQQQSNGSQLYQNYQTQLYLQNASNIVFDFQGSTLRTNLTGGGAFLMFDGCSDIRLLGPKITGAQVMSGGVVTLGAITGGSGYNAPGTYANVPLTGGSGGGAVAGITVAGGAVTSVVVNYVGGGYAVNDVLSCSNSNVGGSGSGFSVPVSSITGAGPVVAVAAPNAITIAALSQPSANITITDFDCSAMFSAVYAVADPTTANTVSGVSLLGYTRLLNGEYGVLLANAGDDTVIENLYTYRAARPFFLYGVQNVNILNAVGDQVAFGFQALVKAYSRSTLNVNIKYSTINQPGQSGSVDKLSFQVQCDPTIISPPPFLQQIYVDYAEANVSGGGGGQGIGFQYFAGIGGTVLTATSSAQLFNNFVIRGFTGNVLYTAVTLNTIPAQCQINFDALTFTHPPTANVPTAVSDLSNNGFVVSRKFTYTPAINWGGASTGWVFSTQSADFYIQGGLCTVVGQITVTTKGSATGTAKLTMPFSTRTDSSRAPLIHGVMTTGGASLTGPIVGFIESGSATADLLQQGAATTAALTDANFTATSNLIFQASYPL